MSPLRHVLFLALAAPLLAYAGPGAVVDIGLSPAGGFKLKANKVTGVAYKNGDGVIAQNVLIDLSTLTTDIGLRDKHTKEHLGVSKYPQAKLIKAVGKGGKGTAEIEIRGVKREVAGTYKVEGGVLKAEFPIEISQFDIKNVRYMGVGVKDKAVVHVELPLRDAPARATASKK